MKKIGNHAPAARSMDFLKRSGQLAGKWGRSGPDPFQGWRVLGTYGTGTKKDAGNRDCAYLASWSGGKDSTASIILAHEYNEPLNRILFSEVMFDERTSGELPEHMEFMEQRAAPLFRRWGYQVDILHSNRTYMDLFNRCPTSGKWAGTGMRSGFPMALKCAVNRDVKIRPIKECLKDYTGKTIQYIGIAADEPERLERMKSKGDNRISLLEKYGYTEQMAKELCLQYGLLSPVYGFSKRGGCWFCPNAGKRELRHLRDCHPDLWKALLGLEEREGLIAPIWNTLTNTSIHRWESRFRDEDAQMTLEEWARILESGDSAA